MWTAKHKRTGNTVELTDQAKQDYETHPATKGLYTFEELKGAKEIKSLGALTENQMAQFKEFEARANGEGDPLTERQQGILEDLRAKRDASLKG